MRSFSLVTKLCVHLEEASQIRDLGLQAPKYLGRKIVKWLHYHVQVVLLRLTFPCPGRTTVYQQRWVQYPPSSVNAFCVLEWHREVTILVPKQIGIEAWQKANGRGMGRWLVQPCCTRLEHPGWAAGDLYLDELIRDVLPCCPCLAHRHP